MNDATEFRAAVLARVYLRKDANDDSVTVRAARSVKVDAYSSLLLSLWSRLQRGSIDMDDYMRQVEQSFDATVGDVPPDAEQLVADLKAKALERASNMAEHASLDDDDEEALTDPQKRNWATIAAGALWAATALVGVYRESEDAEEPALTIWEWQSQDDPATCPDCEALDGQQFARDEIMFWPGESDFGDSLPDGTQCGGNCRCELTNVENERTNAPVQKG